MTTLPIDQLELDITQPVDFLIALYHAESWPKGPSFSAERFERDLPIVEFYHSAIFGAVPDEAAAQATWEMISELGGITERFGKRVSAAPREWLVVFREAFHLRLITPVVWGAAVSYLITIAGGNGAPFLPPESRAAKLQILKDVRTASPVGLMDLKEQEIWRSLPPTVTLFRGGYTRHADRQKHLAQAWSALHWSPTRSYADAYMRARGSQETGRSICDATASLPFRLAGLSLTTPTPAPKLSEHVPFLLRADVPRELVLAYVIRGRLAQCPEVLVDFERITPNMIQDITPDSHQWAA